MDPFQLIDMRSFSSLWYWVVFGLALSTISQRVIGLSATQIERARRDGGQAEADLLQLAEAQARAALHGPTHQGAFLVALWSGGLTGLGILGFGYWFEAAQALFLLMLPLAASQGLSVLTAQRVLSARGGAADLATLWPILRRHRLLSHLLALVSLFGTAFWGMIFVLSSQIL